MTKTPEELYDFATERIEKLESEIATRTEELDMWKTVLKSLKVCPRCKGSGSYRVCVGQPDDVEMRACDCRKSSGVKVTK